MFLVKINVKIHTVILNHLVGLPDKYGLTREPDTVLLISLLIYFCGVDWLASQWVKSCMYDLQSGLSWRYGCWLSIAQKNISKFQRFRNRSPTYLKKITIMTWLTDSRASESVRTCMTRKGVQNEGIVHTFKTRYYTCHKNKIWLARESVCVAVH